MTCEIIYASILAGIILVFYRASAKSMQRIHDGCLPCSHDVLKQQTCNESNAWINGVHHRLKGLRSMLKGESDGSRTG